MTKSLLRKIAAFVAIITAAVSISCCSKNKSETDDRSDMPTLLIGVDYYKPLAYRDYDGKFVGMDVELAEEVCRHIGYKARFVYMDWSDKNSYLLRGDIDCIWCCFSLTGRDDDYSWTVPYLNSREVVAVPDESDIFAIADLRDKRVAVQATTKPDEIFSGNAGVGMVVPALRELNCLPSIDYIFAAVNEGYVDAIAGHEIVFREYMKSSSVELRILDEALLDVQVGVAFRKGTHSDLIEKINKTLYMLNRNGYMAKLIASYGLDPDAHLVNYETAL